MHLGKMERLNAEMERDSQVLVLVGAREAITIQS